MPKNVFAIAAFAALLPFGAAAQPMIQSQEGIALENQILQLQQQVQQLQANGGGGSGGSALGGDNAPPPSSGDGASGVPSSVLTGLLNQVQQLQSQVADLSGRVDTLQNQVNTQDAQLEKEIGDLKFQMGNGGTPGSPGATSGGTPGPGAAAQPSAPRNLNPGPQPAQVAPAAVAAPPASPKAALHAAQEAILHRDYPAAEADARAILATGKASPEGYQAQYILAQSLYAQDKPQESAIAFDDTYNRDRAGPYAPGSLLGLANSLAAIHQEAAACDTLASLKSQFPAPPKGLGPAIEAAGRRAHCS
jgi:TolA-binding protein